MTHDATIDGLAGPVVLAHAGEYARLLVIISDRLSALVEKGVVIERYYNPGNLFREVHIAMTNDDRPDPATVQPMVGDAKLVLHNLPGGRKLLFKTLGWNRGLLRGTVSQALDLAASIQPQLVRCHGAYLNAYLAGEIHRAHGLPFAVSLHTCPEESLNIFVANSTARLFLLGLSLGERALHDAQVVLPVYEAIVPYLERSGIGNVELAYNVINPSNLRKKENYTLQFPVRIVCIGRQLRGKNPVNLIKAVACLPGTHLTLIGGGPNHRALREVAAQTEHGDQFAFIPSIANDALCRMLPDFDLLAYHSEYPELSKVVLEACLTGLPAVVNRRQKEPVPELDRGICLLVDDTVEGYRAGIAHLISDHAAREKLGRDAFAHARAHWHPAATEARYVEVYRRLLQRAREQAA